MPSNPKPSRKLRQKALGSPTRPDSSPTGHNHNVPKTPREIIAAKFGISSDAFLKYREEPGGLIVAILPNGQKHKFYQEAGNPYLVHIT